MVIHSDINICALKGEIHEAVFVMLSAAKHLVIRDSSVACGSLRMTVLEIFPDYFFTD
jgi:hypothetical protein